MDLFQEVIMKIAEWGALTYLIVFVVAFAESIAFIGILIPGAVLVAAAGFVASQGALHFVPLSLIAAAGAIGGDIVSYYIGRNRLGKFSGDGKIIRKSLIERGEVFFKKHGIKSVFLGRFVGPIRPIIPFVAGMLRMDERKFIFWNVLSGIGWGFLYAGIGFFFGHMWKTVELWSSRATVLVFNLAIIFTALYLLKRFWGSQGKYVGLAYSYMRDVAVDFIRKSRLWRNFKNNFPGLARVLADRFNQHSFFGRTLSILSLALCVDVSMFVQVALNFSARGSVFVFDTRLADILYALRDPFFIKLFAGVTVLCNTKTAIFLSIVVTLLLLLWRRRLEVAPFLIGLLGTYATVTYAKFLFERPRSDLALYLESSYSFPSGHTAFAVVIFGFIAYAVWKNFHSIALRVNTLFGAVGLIVLVGFSRLYLGVHYASDVWAGVLLGVMWLLISIGLVLLGEYNHAKKSYAFNYHTIGSRGKIIVSGILVVLWVLFYIGSIFSFEESLPRLDTDVSRENSFETVNSVQAFGQQSKIELSAETVFGESRAPFAAVFALETSGSSADDSLHRQFGMMGWIEADTFNIGSFLLLGKAIIFRERFAGAPVTPLFWQGRMNDFAFVSSTGSKDIRERHVVRVWKTNMKDESGRFIYVATASFARGLRHELLPWTSRSLDNERDFLVLSFFGGNHCTEIQPIIHGTSSTDRLLATEISKRKTDGVIYLLTLNGGCVSEKKQ